MAKILQIKSFLGIIKITQEYKRSKLNQKAIKKSKES